jgi:hypothetical protein
MGVEQSSSYLQEQAEKEKFKIHFQHSLKKIENFERKYLKEVKNNPYRNVPEWAAEWIKVQYASPNLTYREVVKEFKKIKFKPTTMVQKESKVHPFAAKLWCENPKTFPNIKSLLKPKKKTIQSVWKKMKPIIREEDIIWKEINNK